MSIWTPFATELERLASVGQHRQRRIATPPLGTHPVLNGRSVIAFCSNDYLGLSHHPDIAAAVRQASYSHGVGAGAAHLISGHTDLHQRLEDELARFLGLPAALCFSTGYMANLGVVTALVGRGDVVFADRLNHASLNDAMLLSRATLKRYAHMDMQALERALATTPARRRLIVTDSIFSMDGDLSPLPELLALAERFDAVLLIDDAHGFGVLGPNGQGAAAQFGLQSERLVLMGTLGKAAGVSGAFVAGDAVLIDWLINHARTYIYTTATPPLLAAGLLCSLELIQAADHLRCHLQALIQHLHQCTQDLAWAWMPSSTPIQPLLVGESQAAVALSQALLQRGIWVPAIRPPTVAAGAARLRVSLSAAHTLDDVGQLATALHEISASRCL